MSTSYFPAHRPEQTFLCSVNASIQQPTPDPDRPHCVMINIFNSRSYRQGGEEYFRAQAKVTLHSKYPIYVNELKLGDITYIVVAEFSERWSKDNRYELDAEATDSSQNVIRRYVAHNINFLSTIGFDIEHNLNDDSYTPGYPHEEIVSDTFTLRFYKGDTDILTSSTHFFNECHPDSTRVSDNYYFPISVTYMEDGQDTSWGIINMDTRDVVYYDYEVHNKSTFYNFNNPTFNSSQEWLEYCKSL